MSLGGFQKRRKLFWSMISLVVVVASVGLATNAISGYLKSRDPIYQCIQNPSDEPYQVSVPINVTEDGIKSLVPAGIGITQNCTRPVHTLQQNVIHVAFGSPYKFTLGHFLYIWGIDLSKYQTKVYVNGSLQPQGDFLNIPLENGESIQIQFTRR